MSFIYFFFFIIRAISFLKRKKRNFISRPSLLRLLLTWIFIDNLIRTRQMKSLFPSDRKTINLRPRRINNSSRTALRLSRLIASQVRLPLLFRILLHRLPIALSPEEIMHEASRKFQDREEPFLPFCFKKETI